MPTTITLYLVAVWFVVGFATGFGWSLAVWLVNRTFGRLP